MKFVRRRLVMASWAMVDIVEDGMGGLAVIKECRIAEAGGEIGNGS